MNRNINLIAFGTFGNPNGFRQTFFIGQIELAQVVKTFDLNTNAIKLFPTSKIYSIRKESLNGIKSISYSIYTFAKEQNSSRGGTFIGSAILFTNEIASESLTIRLLNDFHENLIAKNLENEVIKVNHSNNLSVTKPKDFDKIPYNLNRIHNVNFNQFSNKTLVVYSQIKIDIIKELLQKSIDLLNRYDTIYFTDNAEIAEIVHHKGLFKLVKIDGFEQEIAAIQNDRKQKTNKSISEFEKDKLNLSRDKKKVLVELNEQILNNKRIHFENESSINEVIENVDKITSYYDEFSKKIDTYINQLKSGGTTERVKILYNENKRIFISSVSELKQPKYVNKIPKVKINSELKRKERSFPESNSDNYESDYSAHIKKIDLFKISTLLLLILWIFTIFYFVLIRSDSNSGIKKDDMTQKTEEPVKQPELIRVVELNPIPNSKLNDNDLNLVLKVELEGKTVSQVVDLIFKKNPTDIANPYASQKKQYGQVLIAKNKDCFKNNVCSNNCIKIIPSYKVE